MFRHYYDSRMFPFLGDLLFDQLFNFDWESSRKEIEKEKKLKKECNKYLRVLDEDWNNDIKVYGPEFKLEDGVYTFKTNVPRNLKPDEITIDAYPGYFYFSYEHKTENGSEAASSIDSLPEDLDINTMKASFKNGVVTVTAKQVVKEEEPKKEEDQDVEFEIEIGQ